ncbi:sugar kinase [Endozoicomonas arenosclerae]|uniref:sugar kinase n=1 Tax=Endozoicomonas arenosclerae TaxID=1633495 RepID=UPI001C129920|nr:sugar kinase [Endozoicomonas arenosclerae]
MKINSHLKIKKIKAAIIGECMIELNGSLFGPMHQSFGGDTLNTAVYLSRSCSLNSPETAIETSYITALGSDPVSNGMLTRWQDEGIDTRLVLRDNTRTPGIYLIQVDDQGERTFLYWRDQSPAHYLLQHPDFHLIQQQLKDFDLIFISGISLAILPEQDRYKLMSLLSDLKRKGIEIVFDSNFRAALWPQDDGLNTVKNCYLNMYSNTDLALVTFDDEQVIWDDKTPEDTLERLLKSGVNKVIVKTGARGCLAAEACNTTPVAIKAAPVETVVDTTSAGDAFNGGFLSSYLAGGSLIASCERGNRLAAAVIQHKGAIVPKLVTNN